MQEGGEKEQKRRWGERWGEEVKRGEEKKKKRPPGEEDEDKVGNVEGIIKTEGGKKEKRARGEQREAGGKT